jgi:glycosyltransferase involved in cell wall biosynthesis
MKVALIHDHLREYGDAERILQVLHRIYPTAPVYTAFVDDQQLGQDAARFANWDIRPTFAQRLPFVSRYSHALRGWLPYFWESLDLSEFDLVISLSGNYLSKSVLTRPNTLHVSYCYTPPKYLWEPFTSKQSQGWYGTWQNTALRQYDFYAAQRVDRFVTNSQRVARRVHKFYNQQAEVIPPPVKIRGEGQIGNQYYLCVGRLSHHQQVELAIQACQQLSLPLWIVGTGSESERLQKMAGDRVRFLGNVSEEKMAEIYRNAKALIDPCPDSDFSFAVVEAMGHGIPVIAAASSGANATVLNYRTGLLFDPPTVEGLSAAIAQFEGLRFSAQACIERAEEFAESVFVSKFEWFIAQAIDDYHLNPTLAER